MNIYPVSLERHKSKRWQRFNDFNFAQEEIVVPIAAAEVPSATCSLPIGFIQEDDAFTLVVILGLRAKQNLLVNPEGSWGSPFLPDCYRCYPFRTALNTDDPDGSRYVVVDEGSGLIDDFVSETDDSDAGVERFFEETGEPTVRIQKIIEFLTTYDEKIRITQTLCETLAKEDLIQPWNVQWQEDGETHALGGLFCIDEEALNNLPAEKFAALRNEGALVLAYGQLFSMQHISKLIRIVELSKQREARDAMQAEVFANSIDSGSLSFDNL